MHFIAEQNNCKSISEINEFQIFINLNFLNINWLNYGRSHNFELKYEVYQVNKLDRDYKLLVKVLEAI